MDVPTDIAKDYLTDFEVLTEARKEFETQLGKWWPFLAHKRVKSALIRSGHRTPPYHERRGKVLSQRYECSLRR